MAAQPSGESATPPALHSWGWENQRKNLTKFASFRIQAKKAKWFCRLHKPTHYLHSIAFSSDLNVLGRLLKKFCMLFSASMAVPSKKYFNVMTSDVIITMFAYTELATREHLQRNLGFRLDLMQLRKIQLSTPKPPTYSHIRKLTSRTSEKAAATHQPCSIYI